MAFPVAHGLLGAAVFVLTAKSDKKLNLKLIALAAFLGVLPDFDYLLNWLRIFGGGWHHGFSHSLLFALLAGFLAAFAVKDFKFRTISAFGLATASHGILDFFITESRGIALFSPFTNHRFKLERFSPIDYQWMSESSVQIVLNILRICLIELIIFCPLFLIVIYLKRHFYKIQT